MTLFVNIKKRQIKFNKEVLILRKLRRNILYKNLPQSYANYEEDFFKTTMHIILKKDDTILSALTLIKKDYRYKRNLNAYQIRGMFTLPKYRHIGIGSKLIQYTIDMVRKDDKVRLLWCNARKNSFNFYKKNYFEKCSGKFYIKQIGIHYKMYFDYN